MSFALQSACMIPSYDGLTFQTCANRTALSGGVHVLASGAETFTLDVPWLEFPDNIRGLLSSVNTSSYCNGTSEELLVVALNGQMFQEYYHLNIVNISFTSTLSCTAAMIGAVPYNMGMPGVDAVLFSPEVLRETCPGDSYVIDVAYTIGLPTKGSSCNSNGGFVTVLSNTTASFESVLGSTVSNALLLMVLLVSCIPLFLVAVGVGLICCMRKVRSAGSAIELA
jgi:hypothetical protein